MTDSLQGERFATYSHVPDPYYGGTQGFDLVRTPRPTPDQCDLTLALPCNR